MATAQTSADKKSAGLVTQEDAGGFVYTMIGGAKFYTGTGVPDHTTSIGSIYWDTASAKLYGCTVADGTWVEVT